MDSIRFLVGCFKPTVQVDIRRYGKSKFNGTEVFGAAGLLIELDKIPTDWKVGEILTVASGDYGRVVIYIKED